MIGSLAVVPVNPPLLVREYDYFMDGVCTGVIVLLDGPRHPRQISWWSTETDLQTPWHGAWFSPTANPDESISGNFDCKGRREHALRKYFAVKLIVDHFVNKDYRDRVITLQHRATHTYEGTTLLGRSAMQRR